MHNLSVLDIVDSLSMSMFWIVGTCQHVWGAHRLQNSHSESLCGLLKGGWRLDAKWLIENVIPDSSFTNSHVFHPEVLRALFNKPQINRNKLGCVIRWGVVGVLKYEVQTSSVAHGDASFIHDVQSRGENVSGYGYETRTSVRYRTQ